MRRLLAPLALLVAALFACPAHAGLRPAVRAAITVASQASLTVTHTSTADEALRVWTARRDVPPPTTVASAVRSWVQCEIDAGVWPLLDWAFLPVDTGASSQINLVGNAYDLTAYNAPTFTPFHGWKGDKVSAYMQPASWSPLAGKGAMGLNDAHVAVYVRTAASSATGAELYSSVTVLRRSGTANYVMTLNESGSAVIAPSSFTGLFETSRLSASTHTNYLAGTKVSDAAVASTTLMGIIVMLKTTSSYSDAELGYMHAGRGLTAAQVAADEQCRVSAYSALGAS